MHTHHDGSAAGSATDATAAPAARDARAIRMAHAIAGQVLTMGRWTQMSKPEGATITFDGYFLTYEELVALMREASDAGRAEPIARGVIAMEGS